MRIKFIIPAVLAALLLAAYVLYYTDSAPENTKGNTPNGTDVTADTSLPSEISSIPAFDLVRISRGGTGVIAGRMAPGAIVELYANGVKVSEVVADKNGEWVIILEEPLEAGSVELNLKARDDQGKMLAEANDVVVVSVPERESDRFMERQQSGVVAVLTPKNGQGSSKVLQKPGVGAYEVGESLSLDTVDYGQGGAVMFAGRALPRVEVRLYLDGVYVGAVKADDGGRWAIALPEGTILTEGAHLVRLDQALGDGKVQLRIEQPFTTGEPLDLSTAKGGVIVRPGNTLWQIARQLYGTGVRYTLIFKENSEQIRDPNLIYPGQIFELPTKEEVEAQ